MSDQVEQCNLSVSILPINVLRVILKLIIVIRLYYKIMSSESMRRPDFTPTTSHEKQRTRIESRLYLHRLAHLGISTSDEQLERIIKSGDSLGGLCSESQVAADLPQPQNSKNKKKRGIFSWLMGNSDSSTNQAVKRLKEETTTETTSHPITAKLPATDVTVSHWASPSTRVPFVDSNGVKPCLSIPKGNEIFKLGSVVVADVSGVARQATVEGYNSSCMWCLILL